MATNVVPPTTSADPREQANAQASQRTGAQASEQPGAQASRQPGAQPPLTGPHDVVEAAGHPAGSGLVKPEYDPRLTNEDLAPLRKQTWGGYNFFAF